MNTIEELLQYLNQQGSLEQKSSDDWKMAGGLERAAYSSGAANTYTDCIEKVQALSQHLSPERAAKDAEIERLKSQLEHTTNTLNATIQQKDEENIKLHAEIERPKADCEMMREALRGLQLAVENDGVTIQPNNTLSAAALAGALAKAEQVHESTNPGASLLEEIAELRKVYDAALTLWKRIQVVNQDPHYISVWTQYQNHGGDYSNGPKYVKELEALGNALDTAMRKDK